MSVNHINRKTHAVEMTLLNQADQQSLALLANDDGQQVRLTVKNVSGKTVAVDGGATSPQLEVRFRKGIVADVAAVALQDDRHWTISNDKSGRDTDNLLLTAKANALPAQLSPGDVWTIVLEKVKGVSPYGAQNSGVTFRFSGLTAGGTAVSGVKRQVISLVNQMPPEMKTPGLVADNKELDALKNSIGQLEQGKNIADVLKGLAAQLDSLEKENQKRIRDLAKLGGDKAPLRVSIEGGNHILTYSSRASGSAGNVTGIRVRLSSESDAVYFAANTTVSFAFSGGIANFAPSSPLFTADYENKLKPKRPFSLKNGKATEFEFQSIPMPAEAGPAELRVRIENLAHSKDGTDYYEMFEACVPVVKAPYVYEKEKVGLGTTDPRTAFDMGNGLISGASHDYQLAQWTMSGGGLVKWSKDFYLKWNQRFIAISMERGQTFKNGHVNIHMPTGSIPKENVYNSQARDIDEKKGIKLEGWESLYVEHQVGQAENSVSFHITNYYNNNRSFNIPGNWLLVATHNGDDSTLKLGTGAIIQGDSAYTLGGFLPTGSIVLWSGSENAIPKGWALCDGENGTPNLQSKFVVGAGRGNGTYYVGQTGGDDYVTLTKRQMPKHSHTITDPGHHHAYIDDYAIGHRGDDANDRDQGYPSSKQRQTYSSKTGISIDEAGSNESHENRPPFYALCYIMKL